MTITVAEAIRRNRRAYRDRTTRSMADMLLAFDREIEAIESEIVEAAARGGASTIIRQTTCPEFHAALLALHDLADERQVKNAIAQALRVRQWGDRIRLEPILRYGLLRVEWR